MKCKFHGKIAKEGEDMLLLILNILLLIFSVLNVIEHEKIYDKAFYSVIAIYAVLMIMNKIA